MKKNITALAFIVLMWDGSVSLAASEDSVVRVFASLRLPNPIRPWAKQNSVEVMGTGVVIDGKRILTNAHIVAYAGEVFVQSNRGGERMSAKVSGIGPGIDLAVLTLEDESFFEKRSPIPFAAKRPATNSPVLLMGYPMGGSGLATTNGIVSRIDYSMYSEMTEGLRIHVTAPASPGNSGGPALVDGKMVGLVFRKMVGLVFRRVENAGVIIPNEEIAAFLEDLKDGKYDGKFRVVDRFQPLVNEALRKKLGLSRKEGGIMVTSPGSTKPTHPIH